MNLFAWVGGRSTPKQDAQSRDRARGHRRTTGKTARAGQHRADGGHCPAGVAHTGRCRHR